MTLFNPSNALVTPGGAGGGCRILDTCTSDPLTCRGSALIKSDCPDNQLITFSPDSNNYTKDIFYEESSVAGLESKILEVNALIPPDILFLIDNNESYFSVSDWVRDDPPGPYGQPKARATLTFKAAIYNSFPYFLKCRLTWALLKEYDIVLTIEWPSYAGGDGLSDDLIVQFPSTPC